MAETGEYESTQDALKNGEGLPKLWLKQIKRAQEDEKAWRDEAKEAVAVYEASPDNKDAEPSAFNILHSNIEVTVPALYNSTPIPDVRRRYGEGDQTSKAAIDVIERSLSYQLDEYDFDEHVSETVRDSELAGRGFMRVRYEPDLEDAQSSTGDQYQQVGAQKLTCEHVPWSMWGHGPARSWAKVPWVYFCHHLSKDELGKLGVAPERIKELAFDADGGDDDKEGKGIWKAVEVYEIWDKASRQVLFVAESDPDNFVTIKPDPIGLKDFFPGKTLRPLRKRKDLTPICPYSVYKNQVAELDKCTRRIQGLMGQLRVRGLYDKRLAADLEQLQSCPDGTYIAAEDSTVFATGPGGLEKAVMHFPMGETITALRELYLQRDQIKQTIYEITGLSDVLRGATDPRETLGGLKLKAQSGSQRLSTRQGRVSRFVRDILRIKSEIICKHYTAQNLQEMTGIQITPEVEALLRNEMMRSYRIDIESDSTIRADVARTQEQMSLFLQGTAQYASAMGPVIQLAPQAKAPVISIYAAFARNFKLGKSAEDALESLVDAASQPQEEKPSPEEQKAQIEREKMQAQMQADEAKGQREMQKMQAELDIKRQMAEIDAQMKQLDLQIAQQKAELEMQKMNMQLAMEQQAMGLKREAMELDREAKIYDLNTRREMSSIDIDARRNKAEMDAEARRAKDQPTQAAE